MNLTRQIAALALLTAINTWLSGCGGGSNAHKPELDVIEARLTTPDGDYRLEAIQEENGCYWPVVLQGGSPEIGVRFGMLPQHCERFIVGRTSPDHNYIDRFGQGVEVIAAETWYQKNDEDPVPLVINTLLAGPQNHQYFDVEAPEALQPYVMSLSGGVMYPRVAQLILDNPDDIHRAHVAFTVHGKPHSLDAIFRLKVKSVRVYGVPGMP